MMNFAVGIACLMIVAMVGEVAGIPNKQPLVKDVRKIDDGSNIFLREVLEKDLKDLELHKKSIKKRKTKLECKIAGGKCEHKKKECHGGYGWCFEGKDYCTHHAHYCCCVPPPPKGCVFGDTSYPDKAFLADSCFRMQCLNGEWNLTTDIIPDMNSFCSAYPLSNIQPFEGPRYQFNETGYYMFTGKDSISLDDYLVEVKLDSCTITTSGIDYSCVQSFTYSESLLAVEIIPAIPGADLVIVNGIYNVTMDAGTSRTFNGLGGSVWVFKESPLNFYLTSSKGVCVQITREDIDSVFTLTTLNVWTTLAAQPDDLGLCSSTIMMVVSVFGEVAGTLNKQLLGKYQRKIKNGTSIFQREDLEEDLKDLELLTKSIKQKKTQLQCKIAGGQCEHKKKECHGGYGCCFEGEDYCTHHAHYCCCVPPPPKGCVLGDTSYPNKAFIMDSCFRIMCLDGEWNFFYDIIDKECTQCSSYPEGNIQPFEGSPYIFNQTGFYYATEKDFGSLDFYGVGAQFGYCDAHGTIYSCVERFVYFENHFHVDIYPAILGPDQVIVDGYDVPMMDGTSRYFSTLEGWVLVFKETDNKFYLTTSKGLSVRLVRDVNADNSTTLDIWTRPPTPDLGLCASIIKRSNDNRFAGRTLRKSNELVKKRAGQE